MLVFVCVFGNILSGYSRSLSENNEDPAVTSLNEWLKKEVAIRVEAKEMSHGLQDKPPSEQRFPRRKFDDRKPRAFYTGNNDEDRNKSNIVGSDERLKKPPCIFCGQENHGIWGCNKFKQIEVGDRWKFAKDNRLCFRCLSVDHRGKDCNRSRQCNVNGCQLNHHRLLHDTDNSRKLGPVLPDDKAKSPREGADSATATNLTMTSCESKVKPEAFSLRTVPVWIKGNGKKVKVNAVLDDASNESFVNEEVTGLLGLTAKWETVQVRVLNDSRETFRSMPLKIEIESIDRQFTKTVSVQTFSRSGISYER